MYPSPTAITKIRAYVANLSGGWSGSTDATILAAYNAPAIANPTTRGTVPTPYTITQLIGTLSSGSLANLDTFPAIYQLMQDIDANNSANVLVAVAFLAAAGKILSSEATAINAVLTATELDPSWSPQISQAQSDLGRPADEDDISTARASQ